MQLNLGFLKDLRPLTDPLDGGASDGLGKVALARTGRAQKERVLALADEARGRELVDERAVDLRVEGEVEAAQRAVGVTEARLLVASGEQPVLAPLELIVDERRDEVERRHLLGLGLLQARFEDVGHAGEAELT